MTSKQTAAIETFTPEQAAVILRDYNGQNRPLRESKAKQIADGIRAGHWKVNGETIVFGISEHLLTGQHRLRACVLAGIPISSWVIRGVDDAVFNTLDQGGKKTAGDILAIAGEAHAKNVAAASRWVPAILSGPSAAYRAPTPVEAQEILSRHPGIRRWAQRVNSSKTARKIMRAYVVAVMTVAAEKYGDAIVDRFFDEVADGVGLGKGSPSLLLRELLLFESGHARRDARTMTALTIKAMKAFIAGKRQMAFLRWSSTEPWPEL